MQTGLGKLVNYTKICLKKIPFLQILQKNYYQVLIVFGNIYKQIVQMKNLEL